jgi:hypothetical protein
LWAKRILEKSQRLISYNYLSIGIIIGILLDGPFKYIFYQIFSLSGAETCQKSEPEPKQIGSAP